MLIKSLTIEQEELLNKGEFLPVMEHFYTIQGEGAHTGKAAYFIRLGGCDVGCHWCDVKDSWEADLHPLMNTKELAKLAASQSKTIIITGGEPLMWNLDFLIESLKALGATVHIETSGAYNLIGNPDWICLSPKKRAAVKPMVLKQVNELKAIIYNRNDFEFAESYAKKVPLECELYLQPEWGKQEEMIPLIIAYVKENPKWKISLQTHKYLDIP